MMKEELAARPEAVALACMDTRSGLLLGLEVRDDAMRDDVETAAIAAAQLCSVPAFESDENLEGEESYVASARWVHAYARVPDKQELVVVGVAPGHANVALLRTWIRHVADMVKVSPRA